MCLTTKKIILILLTIAMIFSAVTISTFAAEAVNETEMIKLYEESVIVDNQFKSEEFIEKDNEMGLMAQSMGDVHIDGDVDGDGDTDIIDLCFLEEIVYYGRKTDNSLMNRADIYHDGDIDFSDIVLETNIVASCFAEVEASGTLGEDISWTLFSDGLLVIDGKGSIPSYSDCDSSISLRSPLCNYHTKIKKIVCTPGIIGIGNYVFHCDSYVTEVFLSGSIARIEENAFSTLNYYDTYNIEKVTSPISVPKLLPYEFQVNALNGTYSTDNEKSLGKLKIFPGVDGVSIIKANKITSIDIPDGVESIYINSCSSLETIDIPDGVESIYINNCSSLETIDIPDGVQDITINNCNLLKTIRIPDSVASLDRSAIQGCSAVQSIAIPFVGTSRTAGGAYDSVFGYIFSYTSKTEHFQANQYYSPTSTYVYYLPTSLKSVYVTDATQIPYGAFSGCQGIEYIELNEGVTEIGQIAFADCGFLSVYIPASVTRIGSNAFSGTDVEKLYVSLNSYGHKYAEENGYPYEIYDYYPVTGVSLNKNKIDIVEGSTYTLTATVEPNNATYPSVTWTSSDEGVATVDENGVVTAVSKGTAIITATTEENNFKSNCSVNVLRSVSSIKLNYSSLNIGVGYTKTLTATVYPETATNRDIIWSTDDPEIATVSNGIVTAVGYGTTKIKATTVDGGFVAECTINSTIPVNGISLNKISEELLIGETVSLVEIVTPTDAFDKSVTWISSDSAVASVENGKVTANSAGNAVITAKTNDGGKTASCVITVKEPIVNVKDITLNKCDISLNAGESETLVATLSPTNATNKEITWISSDESIAIVDTNGKVTAKSNGIAIITVTTNDGNKEATCTVTVSGGSSNDIVMGDANGDGEVDFADAIVVLKHDAGMLTLTGDELKAADVNGDGEVDFVDAIQILKYDSGLISSFE